MTPDSRVVDRTVHQSYPYPLASAWMRAVSASHDPEAHVRALRGVLNVTLRTLVSVLLTDYLCGPRVPEAERLIPALESMVEGKWLDLAESLAVALAGREACFCPEARWFFRNADGKQTEPARLLRRLIELRNDDAHLRASTAESLRALVLDMHQGARRVLEGLRWLAGYRFFSVVDDRTLRSGYSMGHLRFFTGVEEAPEPEAAEWKTAPPLLKEAVYLLNAAGTAVLDVSAFVAVAATPERKDESFYLLLGSPKLARVELRHDRSDSLLKRLIDTAEGELSLKLFLERRFRWALLQPVEDGLGTLASPAATPTEAVGSVIADRFEVLGVLGVGGMATVYHVRDQWSDAEEWALKVMLATVADDRRLRARFQAEYRKLGSLKHRGILGVKSAGELPDGRLYLQLPVVAGGSLEHRIVPGGMPEPAVVALAEALLDALAYLEDRGVVHRDVKPQNVLLDEAGLPLLADFGIALAEGDQRHTRTTDQVGSVAYMAPEVLRGKPATSRSDVYGLAILLHELATGERPEVPGKGIEGWLGEFIAKLGNPDPAARPGAGEALRGLREGLAKRAPALAPPGALTPPAARLTLAGGEAAIGESDTANLEDLSFDLYVNGEFVRTARAGGAEITFGRESDSSVRLAQIELPWALIRGAAGVVGCTHGGALVVNGVARGAAWGVAVGDWFGTGSVRALIGRAGSHRDALPEMLPPGTPVSDYYQVEKQICAVEGTRYYAFTDDRPELPKQRCWECGDEENLRGLTTCASCGGPMAIRRFLAAARPVSAAEREVAFFLKQISHPGLVQPCDCFPWPENAPSQVVSVAPFHGKEFLHELVAPLPAADLLALLQRGAGTLGMLLFNGVEPGALSGMQVVRPPGTNHWCLFSPSVAAVGDAALDPAAAAAAIRSFAVLLAPYAHPGDKPIRALLADAVTGAFATAAEFGNAIQRAARDVAATPTRFRPALFARSTRGADGYLPSAWDWCLPHVNLGPLTVAIVCGAPRSRDSAWRPALTRLFEALSEPHPAAREGDNIMSEDAMEAVLARAVEQADLSLRGSSPVGVAGGASVVACRVDARWIVVASVGDCRAYLIRDGELHQITKDHTFVQQEVDAGRVGAAEAWSHPDSRVLIRALGRSGALDVDVFQVRAEPGDRVLLCDRGYWLPWEREGGLPKRSDHWSFFGSREALGSVRASASGSNGGLSDTAVIIELPPAESPG